MIIRALLATWIYFQVVTIIKWDLSFYIQGHQVSSQLPKEEATSNIPYDIFVMSKDNELKSPSACAVCENNTDPGNSTFGTSSQCEISEDFLQKLFDLMLEAVDKLNAEFRSSHTRYSRKYTTRQDSCDVVDDCRNSSLLPPAMSKNNPLESNEDCEALLIEMEDKMIYIIYQIDLLIASIEDPERLREQITQLQNCVQCLNEKIDIIVKQATTEIADCYEASLGKLSTCFGTQLNNKTEKIQELEIMVTKKTINLIHSNVLASKYAEATAYYTDLRNESLLDDVIGKVYGSSKVEHLLQFGRALYHDNITGRANVYMKLVELMEKNSQSSEINEVIFFSIVKRDRLEYCKSGLEYCWDKGLPSLFANVSVYTINKVDSTIEKWKIAVQNNNFKSLLVFGSPEEVNIMGKAFHDVIANLTIRSFNNNTNFLNGTLNFVSALRWNNQSYTGFKALLSQQVSLDDQLKIAFKMKEKMNNLVGPDEQATVVRQQFDSLVKNLPSSIRGLTFSEKCTLRYNDIWFLYASTLFFEAGNRKINVQTNPSGTSEEHKWKFEKVERGVNSFEFRIKNVKYEEYLGSHIPWRFSSIGYEHCASSMPDYFEITRKYYNWEVHLINGGYAVNLYHVGRRAYLHPWYPEFKMSGSQPSSLAIICE